MTAVFHGDRVTHRVPGASGFHFHGRFSNLGRCHKLSQLLRDWFRQGVGVDKPRREVKVDRGCQPAMRCQSYLHPTTVWLTRDPPAEDISR